jgi:hypothetical protein
MDYFSKAMKIRIKYYEKVWVTGILLAPLLFLLLFLFRDSSVNLPGVFGFYFLGVLTLAVISLPAIFLFNIAYKEFSNLEISAARLKLIMILVAWACLGSTLSMILYATDTRPDNEIFWAIGVIFFSILVPILFYRIKR